MAGECELVGKRRVCHAIGETEKTHRKKKKEREKNR
jgi:hypothetical protein